MLLPWSTAETFTAVKTEQPLLYTGEGFFGVYVLFVPQDFFPASGGGILV